MNQLREQFDFLNSIAKNYGIGPLTLLPSIFTDRWEIKLDSGHKFIGKTPDDALKRVKNYLFGFIEGRKSVIDAIHGEQGPKWEQLCS